ncbi:hypothetical protein [Priestia megaterium]|uniref:hypothetical protein n=1 Tax=Priestia megaterium TaxID=1404 RepID=UPI001F0D2F6E|nr:hypothetical protein [Priestia megaterium]
MEWKSGFEKERELIFAIQRNPDVVTAILLLTGHVSGAFISSGRFTINVSGPIFGVPKTEPALSELNQSSQFFHRTVSKHFYVNPALVEKFTKD